MPQSSTKMTQQELPFKASVGGRLRQAFLALTTITVITVITALIGTWYVHRQETTLAARIIIAVNALNDSASQFRELTSLSQPAEDVITLSEITAVGAEFEAQADAFAQKIIELEKYEAITEEATEDFNKRLMQLRRRHREGIELTRKLIGLRDKVVVETNQVNLMIHDAATTAQRFETQLNLEMLDRLPAQLRVGGQGIATKFGELRRLAELRTEFRWIADAVAELHNANNRQQLLRKERDLSFRLSGITAMTLALPEGDERELFARTIMVVRDKIIADQAMISDLSDSLNIREALTDNLSSIDDLNDLIRNNLDEVFAEMRQYARRVSEETFQVLILTAAALLGLAALAVTVAALAIWRLVLGDIVGRIDRLWVQTSAITHGDLENPVVLSGDDELTALAVEIEQSRQKTIRLIEADQQIRLQADRLALAAETGRLGIFDWPDLNQDVGHYSAELAIILDLGEEALQARSSLLFERLDPDRRDEIVSWFEPPKSPMLPETAKTRITICPLLTANGWRWHELAMKTDIGNERGDFGRAIVAIRDVEEVIDAQERLKVQAFELQRSNEELDRFAYAASHDLKSPMRAIADLAGWLEEDLDALIDEDQRESLQLLRQRAERLIRLLNDLLAYSRVGRSGIEPTEVNVDELARDAFTLAKGDLPFELKVISPLPTITTDATPLHQVFLNLFSNSIKHHDLKEGLIEISYRIENGLHWFIIEDDGPGIEPRYHERIFGMFTTLRPRDDVEGSGIGLAIIKKQVNHFGGTIRIESSPEIKRGCRFIFSWCSAGELSKRQRRITVDSNA